MTERHRILVIDDNEDSRILLERMLQDGGYDVVCVVDGESALDTIEREHFDIVVADVMLPGKSGVQVTWEMREKGIQTPVIATTAYLEKWDRDDLYDCGVTLAIEKPVEREIMLDAIKKIIAGEYLRDGDVY